MAGDHATAAFANDEAIASFRAALAIVAEQSTATETTADAAVDLRAKLANVLWRTGRRGQATASVPGGPDPGGQRGHRSAGRTCTPAWDAWRWSIAATKPLPRPSTPPEALLGKDPGEQDAAIADQWLELMVDGRVCMYTTANKSELALATLEAVRPVLEARGNSRPEAQLLRAPRSGPGPAEPPPRR